MSIGFWARTSPRAVTVASSLFWSSMLDWMPAASAMVAAEQVEEVAFDFASGAVAVSGDVDAWEEIVRLLPVDSIKSIVGLAMARTRNGRRV